MFGKATITLGIGPRFYFFLFLKFSSLGLLFSFFSGWVRQIQLVTYQLLGARKYSLSHRIVS